MALEAPQPKTGKLKMAGKLIIAGKTEMAGKLIMAGKTILNVKNARISFNLKLNCLTI